MCLDSSRGRGLCQLYLIRFTSWKFSNKIDVDLMINHENMRIDYALSNFAFDGSNEGHKEYIEEKLLKVRKHLGHKYNDEVIDFKVDIRWEDTKSM